MRVLIGKAGKCEQVWKRDDFTYNSQHQTILKLKRFWGTDLVVGLFLNECMQLREIPCTLLQFSLCFLCKSKYRGKQKLKRSVTKTAPWHCFQVQKMRVSKTEISKRPEIIREAPLWELRQDNRFHSLHFPGEVSAAPANECEQLGQERRTRSEQEALHPAGDMEG